MIGGPFGNLLSRSRRSYNPDCDDDPDQKDLDAYMSEMSTITPESIAVLEGMLTEMQRGRFSTAEEREAIQAALSAIKNLDEQFGLMANQHHEHQQCDLCDQQDMLCARLERENAELKAKVGRFERMLAAAEGIDFPSGWLNHDPIAHKWAWYPDDPPESGEAMEYDTPLEAFEALNDEEGDK